MWSMIQRTHSIFIRRCTLTIIISWLKSNEEFETLNCTQQHHNSKQKQVNNLLKILSQQAPQKRVAGNKNMYECRFPYIIFNHTIDNYTMYHFYLRREANMKNCGVLTFWPIFFQEKWLVVQLDYCSKAQKMCNYIYNWTSHT